MKNLYVAADKAELLDRLQKIKPTSTRKWGVMTAHQMLVHLRDQLDIALGIKKATRQGPPILRTKVGLWAALSPMPWRKSEKTPKEMDTQVQGTPLQDFEEDKALLLTRIDAMDKDFHLHAHPFFGRLKRNQWGRLVWKHFDHHLRQFGA